MTVAIIPAKGLSTRLPNKNVLSFDGKPLVVHTISQALEAKRVSRVIVSSEDPDILSMATDEGAEALLRPVELCTAQATALDVARHALDELGLSVDATQERIVYLQPTSPLRLVEDIDAAIELAETTNTDAVPSITRSHISPHRLWRLEDDGEGMLPYLPAADPFKRRQNQPQAFALNGAIYVCRIGALLEPDCLSLVCGEVQPYIMPVERSVDIDTAIDFAFAERLFSERKHATVSEGVAHER